MGASAMRGPKITVDVEAVVLEVLSPVPTDVIEILRQVKTEVRQKFANQLEVNIKEFPQMVRKAILDQTMKEVERDLHYDTILKILCILEEKGRVIRFQDIDPPQFGRPYN